MDLKTQFLSIVFKPFSASTGTVAILTRLVVGYGFLQHGLAKAMNGSGRFAEILGGLGVPAPQLMSPLTIAAELGCGLAVLAGAFVPLMCIPMAVILIVAMVSVHLPFGFSSIKLQAVTPEIRFGPPGYEVILLYLVSLSVLAIFGAGPLSVDSLLRKWFKFERS